MFFTGISCDFFIFITKRKFSNNFCKIDVSFAYRISLNVWVNTVMSSEKIILTSILLNNVIGIFKCFVKIAGASLRSKHRKLEKK